MSVRRQLLAIGPLPFMVTVVVPTAIVLLGSVELGWGLDAPFDVLLVAAGALLLCVGFLLWYRTTALFAREGDGTLAPWDPPKKLVVRGPYRHVRNPMISGVMFVLAGETLILGSTGIAIWFAIFVAGNVTVIPLVEEPQLEERFGEPYREYKRNVPPWIPRPTPWDAPT